MKWPNVPMPNTSIFAGFEAPTDQLKWDQAILHAIKGTQLLLKKVQRQISSRKEVLKGICCI